MTEPTAQTKLLWLKEFEKTNFWGRVFRPYLQKTKELHNSLVSCPKDKFDERQGRVKAYDEITEFLNQCESRYKAQIQMEIDKTGQAPEGRSQKE